MSAQQVCELDVVAMLTSTDDEGCLRVPISVTWTYRRDDPYAVQMGDSGQSKLPVGGHLPPR